MYNHINYAYSMITYYNQIATFAVLFHFSVRSGSKV